MPVVSRRFLPILIAVTTTALTMLAMPASAHDGSPDSNNGLSRGPETTGTQDPTTVGEAALHLSTVQAQRAEPDPRLVTTASPAPRAAVPQDRYAMAGGCYAMKSASGKWVVRDGAGYRASAASTTGAERFHFQATDLGSYLLYGKGKTFLSEKSTGAATADSAPSPAGEWSVVKHGSSFLFTLVGGTTGLNVGAAGTLGAGSASPFALSRSTGCDVWPEVDVNVTGNPFGGATPFQEVRGYLDAHTHGMAFEFLGGDVHCGRPWHPYGVIYALKDCPDHELTGGSGALVENFLKGGSPVAPHDTVGWPTFKDWPAPHSLTHEGTYYKWLERSWRGGQRILVNLLVENNKLCQVYPLKRNSCDDMDSIRLQASDMRKMERYIDAQNGGPGKGWYRIVTDPFQARKVINSGKMAIVMGIETSVVFGCTDKLDVPQCSTASIDRQLDEVKRLGVRQMELVNKFDNALAGVAGDTGTAAPLINGANFLETGSFWDMRKCTGDPAVHDNEQPVAPTVAPEQDALFGAVASFAVPLKVPVYGSGPHCNHRGLTSLGAHTIEGLAKRNMLFDPDHMSVVARKASMDLVEKLHYPGVLSSHSWSTPDTYPRIYKDGGIITPYAGDSAGFVDKWKKHMTWADPRYYFGFGYGADINGLGSQGDPRGASVPNKVTYPFKGLGGVTINKQVSGQRVYDINVDGVSHYGLYPDWIEDLRKQAGQSIVDDMARGPEAYLQMWERASGVTNDACRDPKVIKSESVVKGLKKGTSVQSVLLKAGQPHSRLGTKFAYCTKNSKGAKVTHTVTFSSAGKVTKVS